MEQDIKSQFVRGTLTYVVLFVSLFLLHIIFASKNFDIAFKIVAISITVLTFFVGTSIIYFGKINSQRVEINRIGGAISIFLGFGLGWAYAGMQWHWSILFWPFSTVFCHWVVEFFSLKNTMI